MHYRHDDGREAHAPARSQRGERAQEPLTPVEMPQVEDARRDATFIVTDHDFAGFRHRFHRRPAYPAELSHRIHRGKVRGQTGGHQRYIEVLK